MKKTSYKLSAMVLAAAFAAGLFISQGDLGYAAKAGKLSFSKSVKTLSTGSSYTFKVFGEKNNGVSVIWSSSNPKIAKINKKGRVTAVKKGTVTITAFIKKTGKSISQKLKITKKQEKPIEQGENNDMPVDNTGNQDIPIWNPGIIIDDNGGSEDQEVPYQDQEVENEQVISLSGKTEKMELSNDIFTDYTDINDFCYSVFKKVASIQEDDNPVVSPLSAYLALVLAAEGAQGNTRTEFDSLLGKDLTGRVYQLTENLSKVSGSTKLSIADSVWLDDNFTADVSWLSRMADYYNAEIYQTDLSTDAARTGINHWVSNKTKGLIPTLLNENLSKEARLVLMNAIYLKTKWRYVFDAISTYKREFTNEDGKKVQTDFMNESGYRSYFKTEDADGIILPYDDERLSFFAIRPQAGQTARELAQSITEKKLADYRESAQSTDVILRLPKFTVDYSITMNDILETMGLKDAFDKDKADFTGLGKATGAFDQNLYISQVLQKVKVQVAEEGTEAAAVTAIIMDTATSAEPIERTPIEVDFNEPFVYIIADTETLAEKEVSVPLFLGIVTEFLE